MPIHLFDASNRGETAYVMGSLAAVGGASRVEIARALGVHRNTVARVQRRLEEGGIGVVVRTKHGPKGPHKVIAEIRGLVLDNSKLSSAQVSQLVFEKAGARVNPVYIRQLRKQAASRQEELQLRDGGSLTREGLRAEETDVAPSELEKLPVVALVALAEQTPPVVEPPAVVPEVARGRAWGLRCTTPPWRCWGWWMRPGSASDCLGPSSSG
ncbi:MAG: helix-turn-helix domain-containing protein [Candidatus Dormibacteraeota bacterium]|nr:helix-turn-helix domain-containing protein [Candidatus Dormibacteraeota bacterium]